MTWNITYYVPSVSKFSLKSPKTCDLPGCNLVKWWWTWPSSQQFESKVISKQYRYIYNKFVFKRILTCFSTVTSSTCFTLSEIFGLSAGFVLERLSSSGEDAAVSLCYILCHRTPFSALLSYYGRLILILNGHSFVNGVKKWPCMCSTRKNF